mmetsp:Transcript_131672/g.232803  ORF Transcript_131672/g.232803 Transcript_131672/m.232803 type:complete len:458 (+) Transcript_131672:55-1428(+)
MLASHLLPLVLLPGVHALVHVTTYEVTERSLYDESTREVRVSWASSRDPATKCPNFEVKGSTQFDAMDCGTLPGKPDTYFKANQGGCTVQEYSDSACTQLTGTSIGSGGGVLQTSCGVGAISNAPGLYYEAKCQLGGSQSWVNAIELGRFYGVHGSRIDGRYIYRGTAYNPPFVDGETKTFWKDDGTFLYYCPSLKRWRVSVANAFNNMVAEYAKGEEKCYAIASAPEGKDVTDQDRVYNKKNEEWNKANAWWKQLNSTNNGMELSAEGAGVKYLIFQAPDYRTPNIIELSSFVYAGFLNKEYIRATPKWDINGEPTFWDEAGRHFVYYCDKAGGKKIDRWVVHKVSFWCSVKRDKECVGLVRSPTGRHILHPAVLVGWDEYGWDKTGKMSGSDWKLLKKSGVKKLDIRKDNDGLPSRSSPEVQECPDLSETNGQASLSPVLSLAGVSITALISYFF